MFFVGSNNFDFSSPSLLMIIYVFNIKAKLLALRRFVNNIMKLQVPVHRHPPIAVRIAV